MHENLPGAYVCGQRLHDTFCILIAHLHICMKVCGKTDCGWGTHLTSEAHTESRVPQWVVIRKLGEQNRL